MTAIPRFGAALQRNIQPLALSIPLRMSDPRLVGAAQKAIARAKTAP
jgi:hypothetical protein